MFFDWSGWFASKLKVETGVLLWASNQLFISDKTPVLIDSVAYYKVISIVIIELVSNIFFFLPKYVSRLFETLDHLTDLLTFLNCLFLLWKIPDCFLNLFYVIYWRAFKNEWEIKKKQEEWLYLLCAVFWAFCRKLSADIDILTIYLFRSGQMEVVSTFRWINSPSTPLNGSTILDQFGSPTKHFGNRNFNQTFKHN